MLTEEFNKLYEKSVKEGYDDYSLIDYSVQKPNEKDYPNWKS